MIRAFISLRDPDGLSAISTFTAISRVKNHSKLAPYFVSLSPRCPTIDNPEMSHITAA